MKVRDVMTKTPASCSPNTNLAVVVETLWNHNCGVLPIVDSDGKLLGVITDRDICVALGTRNQVASEIAASDLSSGKLVIGKPDDDLRTALLTMAEAKVRRLPVVDAQGRLAGIVSITDILRTSTGRNGELSAEDVVKTLKQISTSGVERAKGAAA